MSSFLRRHGLDSTKALEQLPTFLQMLRISVKRCFFWQVTGISGTIFPEGPLSLSPWLPQLLTFHSWLWILIRSEPHFTSNGCTFTGPWCEQEYLWRRMRNALSHFLLLALPMEFSSFSASLGRGIIRSLPSKNAPGCKTHSIEALICLRKSDKRQVISALWRQWKRWASAVKTYVLYADANCSGLRTPCSVEGSWLLESDPDLNDDDMWLYTSIVIPFMQEKKFWFYVSTHKVHHLCFCSANL